MRILLALVTVFAGMLARAEAAEPARAVETRRVFTTYGFSDPDPIPRLGPIYPYGRFDGYTDTPTQREWKVVELENDYLKVMILPEIGGKIWGAWEKSTGRPFLYANSVVKFRNVAMRGPWTSGGIEANYGIMGHTPNCATPVDYLVERKADGSASCHIGTLDLLTQTYWTIEINLPRDRAYFTTRSFWHNATPLEQPYYTWMNAGVKAAGDLEFVYPGNRYIGHNGEHGDWRVDRSNGRDLAIYVQNDFGTYKSYHVFGALSEFFGAYWKNEDFGMARYSPRDEKPGKKLWIWGLSRQGMIWERLLTDTDGQYLELQSGRLFNQAAEASTLTPFKQRGFPPAASEAWTEYWFPVKGTGGFVQANPVAALNLRAEAGRLKVSLSPLQEVRAELRVTCGGSLLHSRQVELKPMRPFSETIPFSGRVEDVEVTLGGTLLRHRADPAAGLLRRPVEAPKDFDWNSVQGLYLAGRDQLRQRNFAKAEEKLAACLAKDPHYLPALGALAMLKYRNLEYADALELARRALSVDTYDPEANFYYGLANARLGNSADAKDGFDLAAASVSHRSAALLELARLYFLEGERTRALEYAGRSLAANSANVEALQLMAVAHRLSGDAERAKAALVALSALNPLSHFVRFEDFRREGSEEARKLFSGLIRNEMPVQTHLELADWYLSLGLGEDGLAVLRQAPEHPEVLYWMAHLQRSTDAAASRTCLERASALKPDGVFPFRARSVEVLTWALGQTQRWEPRYYLGLVYWSRNQPARARELFAHCGSPEYAPFHAARAALALDDQDKESFLRRALQLDPGQWRYGKLLVEHLLEKRQVAEALTAARACRERFPGDFRVGMSLAKALLMNAQYEECCALLASANILPYEGATEARQWHREAWLMRAVGHWREGRNQEAEAAVAKAREWPENLGAGRPHDTEIDSRLESYLEGLILEAAGNPGLAGRKWQDVLACPGKKENANQLVTALALRKLKREEEGEQLLAAWLEKEPKNKTARWCLHVFRGGKPEANWRTDENLRLLRAVLFATERGRQSRGG